MGVDPILWNCVGSRSYELKKNLDKTTENELICYPPLGTFQAQRQQFSIDDWKRNRDHSKTNWSKKCHPIGVFTTHADPIGFFTTHCFLLLLDWEKNGKPRQCGSEQWIQKISIFTFTADSRRSEPDSKLERKRGQHQDSGFVRAKRQRNVPSKRRYLRNVWKEPCRGYGFVTFVTFRFTTKIPTVRQKPRNVTKFKIVTCATCHSLFQIFGTKLRLPFMFGSGSQPGSERLSSFLNWCVNVTSH